MTTNKNESKTIDASGRTLGRVASQAAVSLMGKDKASYLRHKYSGGAVKVVNASKIRITSKKLEQLRRQRYSGYPGGQKVVTGREVVEKKGMSELLSFSIYQMLPDNKLRREMMKNLKIEN